MRLLPRLALIALCVLTLVAMISSMVSADTFYTYQNSTDNGFAIPRTAGVLYTPNATVSLYNFTYNATVGTSTICYVYNHTGAADTACLASSTFMGSAPITGGVCTFPTPVPLPEGGTYALLTGDNINASDSHTMPWGTPIAYPVQTSWGNVTKAKQMIVGGSAGTDCYTATAAGQYFFGAFTVGVADAPVGVQTLTLGVRDLVDGSTVSGFCVNITSTNTTAPYQYLCNATGSSIQTNYTFASGNITFLNITDGHSVPTYFNTSNTSVTFSSDTSIYGLTSQALLDVSAYRLFLNTSIATLNVTNQRSTNLSATAPVRVLAVNGSNNVQVAVAGNYTMNTTCTVSTPLSTVTCNATDFYDARLTIGGKFGSTSIQNFTITLTNASFVTNTTSTTTHTIIMNLLQGYGYYTEFNASGYSLANATITPVAASTTYNFSVLVQNSFNLTFYNETTNTQLTNVNITVEFISDDYANNFTTENGTLEVSLLVPSDYTIRYWMDEDVPRDYYVTLTPQSYNNLELYIVDTGISNYYIPVVTDQNTNPVAACQISLLRAYILADNSYEYKVVEMEKTDTNGRSVFRVVPNVINYKFVFVCGSATFTTQPTKFTDSTNGYRINLLSDPLESQIAMRNVSATLSYNNVTSTYTFTWVDTNNIVEQGCLVVSQNRLGVSTEVNNACSSGSTGSLIYTINDTNNTKYVASGYLETTTTYSTYYFGPYSVDYTSAVVTFGIVGLIATLLVFITFAFMGNESGVETMIIGGIVAIVVMGVLGFITSSWEAIIGIIIIGGIIVYRTRK